MKCKDCDQEIPEKYKRKANKMGGILAFKCPNCGSKNTLKRFKNGKELRRKENEKWVKRSLDLPSKDHDNPRFEYDEAPSPIKEDGTERDLSKKSN